MGLNSIAGNIARIEQILSTHQGPFSDAEKNACLETLNRIYHSLPKGPFGEFLEQQTQSLFGRVEALYYSSQVASLEQKAQALLEQEDTQEAAEELLEETATLMDSYRGSSQEMQSLARSRQAAEAVLNLLPPEQSHFEFLIGQSANIRMELDDLWYEELLEIGELVYEGDIEGAKKRFKQLPPSIKNLFRHNSLFHTRGFTLQALIHAAYQCVGNSAEFPTEEEAEEFFKEALEFKNSTSSPLKNRVECVSIHPRRP